MHHSLPYEVVNLYIIYMAYNMAAFMSLRIIVIYVVHVRAILNAAESSSKSPKFPLDSGPSSFQHLVPPSRANLPQAMIY